MAAGSAFTLTPTEVLTVEPEYHNVITESESMKKDYQNISTTKVQKYQLKFRALSNTDRDILQTHFEDQSGEYHSFSWQSVPSYIGGGANITGRWIKGSLKMRPISNRWDCEVGFEKDN